MQAPCIIVYEDNHLLVVQKPPMLPVQADASGDQDLLSALKNYIGEKYQKPGAVYLGLVHRLDRPAGGLMVFARTSKAAARLSEQVRTHSLKRRYLAVVCGNVMPQQGQMEDWLLKDSRENTSRAVPEGTPGAKPARLNYRVVAQNQGLSLVNVQLQTGRSHQIRVQFSTRGWPLWGDQRYNPAAMAGQPLALFSCQLSLMHPTTKQQMNFTALPPQDAQGFFPFIPMLDDAALCGYN